MRAATTVAVLLSISGAARAAEGHEHEAPIPSASVTAGAQPVARGSGSRLVWDPAWRRFGLADGVVTAMGTALGLGGLAWGPDEDEPRRGRVGFDEAVRDALRSDDYDVRRTWRDVSDVLVTVNLLYPFVGDALVNAAWYRDSPDVAWQLTLLNVEALAVTFGIHQTVASLVSRERPYGRTCGTSELSETNRDCEESDRYRSFFSSHTAMAFTGAAVTCTHHAYVPLHGGRGEWIPCAAGLVIAAGTGVARIGADFHYATDVLTGALTGSLVGWLVPWLHYTTGSAPGQASLGAVRIGLAPVPGGLGVMGSY